MFAIAGLVVLLAVASYLAAGWVAYEAAIASTKGWVDAVLEIGRLVEQERARATLTGPIAGLGFGTGAAAAVWCA